MNQSNLEEFFPSLIEKGYTVREINESCNAHKNREVPDAFKSRFATYQEYIEALIEYCDGL